MVLCFVEVVSGGYAMGRQYGLPLFQQICLCFLFKLLLSQMYDFTPMIFTAPLWGSEVANSKTEIHLTNTAGEVGMRYHILSICDVTTIEREGDFTSLGICYCVS